MGSENANAINNNGCNQLFSCERRTLTSERRAHVPVVTALIQFNQSLLSPFIVHQLAIMADDEDVEMEWIAGRTREPFPLPVERVVPDYPSVTERYYDVRYKVPSDVCRNTTGAGDQCVLFHSNR